MQRALFIADQGLTVDLSSLKNITVDPESRTATVQGMKSLGASGMHSMHVICREAMPQAVLPNSSPQTSMQDNMHAQINLLLLTHHVL